MTHIRFTSYPRTVPPPSFVRDIVDVFVSHELDISTISLAKGLDSNGVLGVLRHDLVSLGFDVEKSKKDDDKIKRPVFFGENGEAALQYEVDAYHPEWRCGMEVEAGRAWMGNAFYRDIVQALVMVEVDTLVVALPNAYKYQNSGRPAVSNDYEKATNVAQAVFGHSRVQMPYSLVVIGY